MKLIKDLGKTTIEYLKHYKRINSKNSLGDYYRNGGNNQLYKALSLDDLDLVIDAGGYHGEWTSGIVLKYGCRAEVFEPVPDFAKKCQQLFLHNSRVRLHMAALGSSNRTATFTLSDVGTSEFSKKSGSHQINSFEAQVIGVSEYLQKLTQEGLIHENPGAVGCLKLNIEGGEYEVLEKLIDTGEIDRFRTLLVQFHKKPEDWQVRYEKIIKCLKSTHQQVWCYPMVWEKWQLI
jgi:FkbM family methyltransferase